MSYPGPIPDPRLARAMHDEAMAEATAMVYRHVRELMPDDVEALEVRISARGVRGSEIVASCYRNGRPWRLTVTEAMVYNERDDLSRALPNLVGQFVAAMTADDRRTASLARRREIRAEMGSADGRSSCPNCGGGECLTPVTCGLSVVEQGG